MPLAVPRAPRVSRLALAALLALGAACGGDDGAPPIDGPAAIDASPNTCTLPTQPITCTAGDNTPCTAACDTSYCHLFGMVGAVCTMACTVVDDCPSGWSCNTMGRCRPPG